MNGIKVTGYIRPISLLDNYPTHLDNLGKGGIHSVASLVEREAISLERRSLGMMAFDAVEKSMYSLLGSLDNTGWTKIFDFKENKLNFNVFCNKDYVLVGNKNNIAQPSPILIDIKQDIIDLKRQIGNFEELKKLDHNRIWIGDYTNEPVPQLQIGTMNLPTLGAALFPEPTGLLPDIAIPNPTFNHLSLSDWIMSGPWLPQVFVGKADATDIFTLNPSNPKTTVSSSLAMTQINAIQAIKRLDNAGFIVKSKKISWAWENLKMALVPSVIKKLYNLDEEYTFSNAQALDEIAPGILKQNASAIDAGVADGNIVVAIAGQDYVDVTADITNTRIALIKPAPAAGVDNQKLLARSTLELKDISPADAKYILQKPNVKLPSAQALSELVSPKYPLGGILKSNIEGVISIASGGDIPVINDYVTPTNLQAEKQSRITADENLEQQITAEEEARISSITEEKGERIASDEAIEASVAALEAEVEAEIAALAAVEGIDILGTILGFVGLAATGKNYGEYIRGLLLNVKNKWTSADLNDEGHNAVGDYEFRWPSGYSSDDRGHGTLWFDSDGRSSGHKSEAGLRLFSWDSGGDHIGSDSPIAPLHIGLFGYQNKYHIWPIPNPTAKYKGFIFSIPDFHNEDSGDDYYRFPKKFGLYDVTRTISTSTTNRHGWDSKKTIFEYDYQNFTFSVPVVANKITSVKELNIPVYVTGTAPVDSFSHGALWIEKS